MPPTSPLLLSLEDKEEQSANDNGGYKTDNINMELRPGTSGTVKSDAVFNEFRALVEHAEQSDTQMRFEAFKKQFRGSNPYIRIKKSSNKEEDPAKEGSKNNRRWRRAFDPLQPTCRKCGLDVKFSENECFASCTLCGNLVNLMEWKTAKKHLYKKQKEELNKSKYSKNLSSKSLRPTYGEIVKQRLNEKVKERFATEMADICNVLARRQLSGKPLGENIWKQFDLVQARLRNNLR